MRRITDHLIQIFADTHSAEHVERVMQAAYLLSDEFLSVETTGSWQ
ncbi:hypothetical protein [Nonomuraea gerenzanensis]